MPHEIDSLPATAETEVATAPDIRAETLNSASPVNNGDHADVTAELLQLKLFLRHECPSCSEQAVAQEIRQMHHVRRVRTHPVRHEIDVWIDHLEHGLMREIGGILDLFCCKLAACHLR